MTRFEDRSPIGTVTKNRDGMLSARVLAARTGIYQYHATELGLTDDRLVNVYRSVDEVMKRESLGTFKAKAIVDGHPAERVTADNDKELRRGTVMGVARDGEAVALDVAITDAALVKKIENNEARELSAGYLANIEWVDGVAPDGTPYEAIQTNIYVDHLAVVTEGRAGSEYRIGDSAESWGFRPSHRAKKEANVSDNALTSVVVADQAFQVNDQGAAAIKILMDAHKGELKDLNDKVSGLEADIETKDGEIKALEKSVGDAKLSDADLSRLVAARSSLISDAKKMGMDEKDMENMSAEEIKKAASEKAMGDKATGMSDAELVGAFPALVRTHDSSALRSGIKAPSQQSGFGDGIWNAAGVKKKGGK